MKPDISKVPPCNEQAERDILVAATLSREALFKVLDMDEQDFYFSKHRLIYKAMCELNAADVPVDVPTLFTKLQEKGDFEKVGGGNLINDFQKVVYAHSVPYLINDIREKRKHRDIINATRDLYQAITESKISVEDAGEKMIRLLNELSAPVEAESQTVKDMAERSLDSLFGQGKYIESKIPSIRRILNFFEGQLITIAARPGQGKSALALQMAEEMDGKVLFFALEMKAEHMYSRMLSKHAKVEAKKIKAAALSPEEFQRVASAHINMSRCGNIVFYDKAHTIAKISNIIRKECEREKPCAVFIDYLQLVTGGEGENQNYRIGYITRSLKLLAMRNEIPIFILAQLNRELEKTNREPVLSDIRDSGSVEQDADVIIFLHGDKDDKEKTKFIVAKNRDGDTGYTEIYFNKRYTFFQDYERIHVDGPTVNANDYRHD